MGPSNLHTQLQFNRNVPSLPDNLAVRYSGPRPIVIEKLRPPDRASAPASAPGLLEGPRHRPSVPFSVVSEEKLSLAVRLAKRDVKRKQLAELVSGRVPHSQPLSARKFSPSRSELTKKPRGPLPGRQRPSQGETAARAKVYLSRDPRSDSSPPMRDRGPQPCALKVGHPQSVLELQRLQKELSACLQSIEGLATKDRLEEGLDPDEAKRSRVRRQEQAARTARTLYALQQQVKELQEELDKLSPNRIKHTKKSRAMSRLAAAHRGAIRALRMFVSQFTDSKEQAVSERYRELGDLIRQLSICSARLDTDPSVLAVVLDLLQQIEELDSLLERKQSLGKIKKRFPGVRSQSPLGFPMALERSISTSPVRERKPLVAKEKLPLEGRRPVVRKLLEDEHPSFALSPLYQILGEGLKGQPEEDLASSDQKAAFKIGPTSTKAKAMKKRPLPTAGPLRRRGVETAAKSEQSFHKVERLRPHQAQGKDHRFQRMTVSFRLKRNQPPVKDHRTPWIPPNPTSPLASPKCIAWGKGSVSPKDAKREPSPQQEVVREGACADPIEHEALRELDWHHPQTRVGGSQPQRRGRQRKCLQTPLAPSLQTRLAWLDAESARRLKELDKLKARELADIRRLSASTSELADKVEKAVLERLKPLLDQAKEADAPLGDSLSVHEAMAQAPEKALPRKELPDCTPRDLAPDLHCKTRTQVSQPEAMGFQDEDSPDLWTMMRRMEEMERYQEAVRRRFSQMVYADLDFGTERGRSNGKVPAVDERPRPPNPIQLTKRAGSGEPQVNILLEKPLDEKYFEESMDMEERGEKGAPLRPASSAAPQQPEGSILLSVPREMLRNLGNYQDSYQQYLRTISHESIGTFNPWIIVESLAEELVEEALEDVTAELQDVCEDYAEAVFTSEFLEPSK
ncbi:protein moonraker isoform X2 [Trichosurus vulpecula]|uniref:protein moonraker isoform X2 n=1 Tax=Trichosurus vulpecula TaxID=9337 RepID=UPI00186B2A85|nr:protein moonraker isoform X2 [Trichosurus vulpecula]